MPIASPSIAPAAPAAPPPSCAPLAAPTCDVFYVRAALGRADYADRRLFPYIARLIDQRGFPAPLPVERGGRLHDGITANSRWLRDAVDAWFANLLPPGGATLAERRAEAAAAEAMDRRAAQLVLIKGGRA